MKKINQLVILFATLLLLVISREKAAAQDAPPPGGPPPGMPNFDPAQMREQIQQRMLDTIRERLAVTNDTDWNALQPLVTKLTDATMDAMMQQIRGFMGNRGGRPGFLPPDPDADALQNLIDTDAPRDQIKAALAKYRASVAQKKAVLAQAKEDLRQVLTIRQEATLTAMGIL